MHPLVEQLVAADGLPRAAIRACLADIDAVSPDLLALVEKAANGTLETDESDRFFFGLHILGAARDRRVFPVLLRLLRRPKAELDELLGDADTVTLPRILASCFDGRAGELFALVRDPAVDEYARDSMFGAIAFLTWEGRIDQAATHAFIEWFGRDRPVPDDDFAWFGWSRAVELLARSDLAPLVEEAYADGRIPPEVSELKDFRAGLAEALAAPPDDGRRFKREGRGYLEDPVQELEMFNFERVENERVADRASSRMDPPSVPAQNPMRHVGRNDPCPCGSGKKYKKCCGMAA